MISCPNTNSKEWKELEKEVGEPEAIKLFILNKEEIPSLDQIETLRMELVESPITAEVTQSVKRLVDLRKSVQLSLNTTLNIYNKKKAGKQTTELKKILTDLKTTIRNFENADVSESLAIFLNNTNGILSSLERKRDSINKEREESKKQLGTDIPGFTLTQLNQGLEILEGFDILDSIKEYVDTTDDIPKKLANSVSRQIASLQSRSNGLNSTYKSAAKSQLADVLGQESTIQTGMRRRALELIYKADNDKKKSTLKWKAYDKLMNASVEKQLIAERPQLVVKERDYIYNLLSESPGDISAISAWIVDPRNVTQDSIIQTAVGLLDRASSKIRTDFIKDRAVLSNAFEEFSKKVGTEGVKITDQRELYKNMLEKNAEGKYTGFYTRKLKFEYYNELSEMKAALAEIDYQTDIIVAEIRELKQDPEKNKERLDELTKQGNELFAKRTEVENKWFSKFKTTKPTDPTDIAEWESTYEMYYDKVKKEERPNRYIRKDAESGQYKDLEKDTTRFDYYNKLVDFNKSSDKMVKGSGKQLGMKLPGMKTKTNELINRADSLKEAGKSYYKRKTDSLKREADDYAYGNLDTITEDGIVKVIGTQSGQQFKSVSVPFRADVPIEDQSFDLSGMAVTNRYVSLNFKHKHELKDTLELTKELVGSRKFDVTSPGTYKKMKQVMKKTFNISDEEETEILQQIKEGGKQSNSYKLLTSVIEDRLYGLSSIPGGEMFGLSVDKIANKTMEFAANQMLILNWGSGAANILQGKTMNFLGSVQGDVYDLKNLHKGEVKYTSPTEMLANMQDIGKLAPTSKTNILMELFIGDSVGFDGFINDFTQDSQIKRLGQVKNLHMVNGMAEHYIQGTLMYAIMDSYKAKNKPGPDGDYIDIEGNIVKDEKDAATLDQVFTVDSKGNFENKKGFYFDNVGNTDNIENLISNVSRIIQDKVADLQGNYSQENKSMIQRYWWGKLGIFLRKFIQRGIQSRWKGFETVRTNKSEIDPHLLGYSEASKTFKEGTYVTLGRFMSELYKHKEHLGAELLTKDWNNLTTSERGNIRKAIMEIGIMFGALFAAKLLADLADEDDDNEALYFAAYLSRRMWNELFFFTPVSVLSGEAVRFLETPTAALNIMKTTGLMLDSMLDDATSAEFHQFGSGRRKGEYKSWVYLNKTLNPFYKNFVDYSYRDKYNFAANAR